MKPIFLLIFIISSNLAYSQESFIDQELVFINSVLDYREIIIGESTEQKILLSKNKAQVDTEKEDCSHTILTLHKGGILSYQDVDTCKKEVDSWECLMGEFFIHPKGRWKIEGEYIILILHVVYFNGPTEEFKLKLYYNYTVNNNLMTLTLTQKERIPQ